MLVDRNWRADIVPVDLPVNLMIATAWHVAKLSADHRSFYNCTVDPLNSCTWGKMDPIVNNFFREKVPLENVYRTPNCRLAENEIAYKCHSFVGHTLPSFVVDSIYRLFGWRPRLSHLYTRVEKMVWTLQYFSRNHWEWDRQNADLLAKEMSPEDLKVFFVSYDSSFSWKSYLEDFCLGAKKYLLGEDCSEKRLAELRVHMKRVRMAYMAAKLLLAFVVWRYVLPLIKPGVQLKSSIVQLIRFLFNIISRFFLPFH